MNPAHFQSHIEDHLARFNFGTTGGTESTADFREKLMQFQKAENDLSAPTGKATSSKPISSTSTCCQWCQRPFRGDKECKEHNRRTQPRRNGGGPWVCYASESTSDAPEKIDAHITHETVSSSPSSFGTIVNCFARGCDKIFSSHGSQATHIINVHDGHHIHRESRKDSKSLHRKDPVGGDSDGHPDLDDWEIACQDGHAEESSHGGDSDNEDLGELLDYQNVDVTTSVYGTSVPKHSFSGPMGNRGSLQSPLTSLRKGSLGLASPRSFQTAHSSLASYTTAPSGSQPSWKPFSARPGRRTALPSQKLPTATQDSTYSGNYFVAFEELLFEVVADFMRYLSSSWQMQKGGKSRYVYERHAEQIEISRRGRDKLQDVVREKLKTMTRTNIVEPETLLSSLIPQLVDQIAGMRVSDIVMFDLQVEDARTFLGGDIMRHVLRFLETRRVSECAAVPVLGEVFSSVWLSHLYAKGILLDQMEELNWSGKGQHVEYGPHDENEVPLSYEKTLGHSQTAVVESVRCRRIRLARKKIVCSRRLKKEDAIVEVEHLTKLHHLHILRVVGTYTLKRELAILLYPAAEWDLDKFMDELLDDASGLSTHESSFESTQALVTFFGCLSNAVEYIHAKNVKHMDIKPKNILVRWRKGKNYRVYIADFGIARAYTSAADAETNSPTSFTRTYAAPEVVHQDTRGFSADIFSLGCVYMEMMAVLSSCLTLDEAHDDRQKLLDLRQSNSNPSFYANIQEVIQWYDTIIAYRTSNKRSGFPGWDHGPIRLGHSGIKIIPNMILSAPDSRPSASELKDLMAGVDCSECDSGPEPFEAAE